MTEIKLKKLASPIFLIGHARAGTTALSASINWAEGVGPNYPPIQKAKNLPEFVSSLKDYNTHLEYSDLLEQKDIWFRYLPGKDVFTHMGRELYADADSVSESSKYSLVCELTSTLGADRYFSKAPSNSFRIPFLMDISCDPRFVVVVRNGCDVVASWGKRPYGFNRRVNWGEIRSLRLSFRRGIKVFARKWNETIDAIKPYADDPRVLIVNYSDMLVNWTHVITRVYEHCGLAMEKELLSVNYENRPDKWRESIPTKHHRMLEELTEKGNE
ncbi:MAG: sulfotransferase, partial [Pseudomonadota bacterium]